MLWGEGGDYNKLYETYRSLAKISQKLCIHLEDFHAYKDRGIEEG